ncbi:MAG: VOC family protein [Betaproteobacteria bacterium]
MPVATEKSLLMQNRSMPDCMIIPVLLYADVPKAAAWLCGAFGFVERLRIGDHRIQLVVDGGAIVVARAAEENPGSVTTHQIMMRVVDVDGHCERARQHGAIIHNPPTDFPYGERQYSTVDCGGHAWTFSQTTADVIPASWGGILS